MKLTRTHAQAALATLATIGIAIWFAMSTEWVDVEVPPQLRGPAKTDRLYAFKAFTKTLGVELATPDNLDRMPPAGATLVLNSWFWDMFPERRGALQRWVESGGHLVLPNYEYQSNDLEWTTITSARPSKLRDAKAADRAASGASTLDDDDEDEDADEDGKRTDKKNEDTDASGTPPPAKQGTDSSTVPKIVRKAAVECPKFVEPADIEPAFEKHRSFTSCAGNFANLQSPKRALWAIDNSRGHTMLRIPLGKGTVTATNLRLGIYGTSMFENDDALLLAAALRLERGQQLWLVSDEKRPPLLETLWKNGAPVILLGAVALALALWRNGIRFGPRMAAPPAARRSVGEQIRGTAAFVAHHGGRALHHAQLRALDICARSRVPGYDALIVGERAAALAPLVGIDTHTLARAMNPDLSKHLPSALALLETARRRLLLNPKTDNKTPHSA